jgi:Rad3-related DNA helicase
MVTGGCFDKFCYLVSSKALQDQIIEDFPEALSMKGRNNYPCALFSRRYTAAECTHTTADPCSAKSECAYERAKQKVLRHDKQILNYTYQLIEGYYVGRFSDYPIIIADEADMLEGHLADQVSIKFSLRRMRDLGIPVPKYKSFTAQGALDAWKRWGDQAIKAVKHRFGEVEDGLDDAVKGSDEHIKLVRELQILGALSYKITALTYYMDDTWLVDIKKKGNEVLGWEIKPTWLSPELTQAWFFKHADRFLMMSATFPVRDVLAELLGLSTGDIDVVEVPSSFPVSNRPVYLMYAASLNTVRGNGIDPGEIFKAQKALSHILDTHRGLKGIVHTVNWKLNEVAMQVAGDRGITHDATNKYEQLDLFYKSKRDLVFISPSSTRGIDLYDDRARFNVVFKNPFQYLGDKLVSARVFGKRGLGEYWYRCDCGCSIVQACGRAVRHKDDWCESYIIDTQACNLITGRQGLFPRYFLEAVDVYNG